MLTRLWSFLTGYVSLIVEGKNLEKLINMSINRGLYLWDVKWLDQNRAIVKVRLNGIRAMRHIARRTKSRFKIIGKSGLPFGFSRLKKRKLLVAGAILSILLVSLMSSFIWFVEVRGNKRLSAEKVITVAEHAGLAMGTLKIGLDKDQIEKYIKNEIPEVSWVGVKITGTKALIEIAEKTILTPVDNSPANVVAEKEGLVEELLVLSGKPAVSEGSMVKQGDVLISGIIKPDPKPEDEQKKENQQEIKPVKPVRIVRARGIVRAKVWYDGYSECRLVETGTKRTGRSIVRLSLRLFDKVLVLKGPKTPPFRDFVVTEDIKKAPEWRKIRIPVEIVTSNYYEVSKYRDIIGVSEAKSIAERKALSLARATLPTDARVAKEIVEEIQDRGSNMVRVKVVLEVLEEIGRVEPLRAEDIRQLVTENPDQINQQNEQ